ncbi:MAG: POTRA domain-containing protein [Acidobacteriota bacterium]
MHADDAPRIRAIDVQLLDPGGGGDADRAGAGDRGDERAVDLRAPLPIAPGDTLDAAAVRRTLDAYHATGRFADVALATRPAADGAQVDVVVRLRPHVRVRRVQLVAAGAPTGNDGELTTARRRLRPQLAVRPNAPLNDAALAAARTRIERTYARLGYRQARARAQLDPVPGRTDRVDVRFTIDPGPASRVAAITFRGDRGSLDDDALRAALQLAPGHDGAADQRRLDAEAARLQQALVDAGHPSAQVDGPSVETASTAGDALSLIYRLDAGPPAAAVTVVGVDEAVVRRLRRRGLLDRLRTLRRGTGDEATARRQEACRAVRSVLQARGHYLATVTCQPAVADPRDASWIDAGPIDAGSPSSDPLGTGDPSRDTRITIRPGPRFRVAAVALDGAMPLPAAQLRARLTTATRDALGRPGRLIDEQLEADLGRLRSFLALEGYRDAQVGPAAVETRPPPRRGGAHRLFVTIPVALGRAQRVVQLRIDGIDGILDGDRARAGLALTPGGPFHPQRLDDSVAQLQRLLEDRGHPYARVTPDLRWDGGDRLVEITLAVEAGPRIVVDRVLLRGHGITRDHLLRRRLPLRPGQPLSRRARLEAERALYQLGVFSRVDVTVGPLGEDDRQRDVVVTLEEASRWRLGYGISYHSDDGVGGLLSIIRANLTGRADRLQIDLRANRRDRRFRLAYDQPTLGGQPLQLSYRLFAQDEERDAFTSDDRGVQIALDRIEPRRLLGLRYDYRRVTLQPTAGRTLDPGDVPPADQAIEISSLTTSLFVDRRDDPLDPRRGWSSALRLEYAFPAFDADADFIKVFGQQTILLPLGGGVNGPVLATSLRAGAIEPQSDAADDPFLDPSLSSARVPASERFFAGGRTSHRAYERDRLGVVGETLLDRDPSRSDDRLLPVGGNALLLLNVDLRIPLARNLGVTVFADWGNVWADWRAIDLDALRLGLGLGLRYRAPIGPIRLEVGWKVDPRPDEDRPVFLLSFGNPF